MYRDRLDAGHQLAQVLRHFKSKDLVILALPRGGVVLGAAVAKELEAPLGVVVVRKIGHPSYSEYAIGAIAEDEEPVYNEDELSEIDDEPWLREAELSARQQIEQRRVLYYGKDFTPPKIEGKVVIIIDDGIATGLTMEAAIGAVENQHPKRIIVAVPVASEKVVQKMRELADEVIVLEDTDDFKGAVGAYYQHFDQVSNDEVSALLREANQK